MPELLFTPSAISSLNQFLLSLIISLYLGRRFTLFKQQKPSEQDRLLFIFFGCVTVFSLLLFLDASLLPSARLPLVYLENLTLGIMLVALIQFAYHFPNLHPAYELERRIVLLASVAYSLVEAAFAIWRFYLLTLGQVEYRAKMWDLFPIAGFLWVVFVFTRSALQKRGLPASRQFALIFIIPSWLALLNLLRSTSYVSAPFYQINVSIGILATIFLFALNYLMSQPEKTSLIAKISGMVITLALAVLGMIGWVVTPVYAAQYVPALKDHRTLRFTPTEQGGYQVVEALYYFNPNFGQKLALTDSFTQHPAEHVTGFEFPFFGRSYTDIWVLHDGAIGFGAELDLRDLEFQLSGIPAIFALLLDLNPDAGDAGGVYLLREPHKLTVTYAHLPSFYRPDCYYTFQVVLRPDGSFDITYNGLPSQMRFNADDRPDSVAWVIGIKPGQAPQAEIQFNGLPQSIGPEGAIQDEYRAFRVYQHQFLLPLAKMILLSSLLFLVGLPLILRYTIARPLDALLQGVQALNTGTAAEIPIGANDEIGYLTQSFNEMGRELDSLVKNLEKHVSERTSDLQTANVQLRKLSIAVEQSPSTIVITDLEANIEYVNPAFTRSTGYTFEEVRGQNPRILKSNLTPPETYVALWETLLSGNAWRGELCNRKKNGQIYWEYTVIAPIKSETGAFSHYVAVKEDVTARKLAEQAAIENESRYRNLFELESDALFIIRNHDGRILEVNSAATTLYGYSREELLRMKNTDLSAEPEATRAATLDNAPVNQVVKIPLRWHHTKDGLIFPVDITARFIQWNGEEVHIAAIRDITERRQAEEELERLAISDPLTGLYNRRHFYLEADKMIHTADKQLSELAALMIDIDHFKEVNDTHGHSVGDAVLREAAHRLKHHLRPQDLICRYGGEEFVLLLPVSSVQEAHLMADRLLEAINGSLFKISNIRIALTISIGVAQWQRRDSLDNLLTQADKSLYEAKEAGRNRWVEANPAK